MTTNALEIRCSACDWTSLCDLADMIGWLQRHGRLRRAEQPDPALVVELFSSTADLFACPNCEAVGLVAGPPREDAEDWGSGRPCEVCGQAIPPERLEVFPDARVCARCKGDEEAGRTTDEPDYCPRCGAIMQLTAPRGSGISRYTMVCPECGRR